MNLTHSSLGRKALQGTNIVKDVPFIQLLSSQITLCDYNILDFDLIERIADKLNANQEKEVDIFIKTITLQLKHKNNIKNLHENKPEIIQIQKLITFLYTIILNIKLEQSILLILRSDIFPLLLLLLKTAKSKSNTDTLAKIILICLFDEYNQKFTSSHNEEVTSLYLKYYEQFSSQYNNPFQKLSKKSYKRFFEQFYIISLKISQMTIANQHFQLSESQVSQSLIEILLSQEIKEVIEGHIQYMYLVFLNLIKNNMENTKKNYGNKYTTLYRKDELSTEIIKHLFICLGNYCYVKSFVNPFQTFLLNSKVEQGKTNSNNEEIIDKKYFIAFFFEMLTNLKSSLSVYLKVILKLIYKNVNEVFEIEKDNYAPLFTALIFNYFVSPKIQEIYSIHSKDIPILSQFNRLLRNICYKTMFFEKDDLFSYNDIITYCHEQLYNFIHENVIKADEESELNMIRMSSSLILPKFLLLLNSQILIKAFDIKVNVFEDEFVIISNKNNLEI